MYSTFNKTFVLLVLGASPSYATEHDAKTDALYGDNIQRIDLFTSAPLRFFVYPYQAVPDQDRRAQTKKRLFVEFTLRKTSLSMWFQQGRIRQKRYARDTYRQDRSDPYYKTTYTDGTIMMPSVKETIHNVWLIITDSDRGVTLHSKGHSNCTFDPIYSSTLGVGITCSYSNPEYGKACIAILSERGNMTMITHRNSWRRGISRRHGLLQKEYLQEITQDYPLDTSACVSLALYRTVLRPSPAPSYIPSRLHTTPSVTLQEPDGSNKDTGVSHQPSLAPTASTAIATLFHEMLTSQQTVSFGVARGNCEGWVMGDNRQESCDVRAWGKSAHR